MHTQAAVHTLRLSKYKWLVSRVAVRGRLLVIGNTMLELPSAKSFKMNLKINTVFFGKQVASLYFDTFEGCLPDTLRLLLCARSKRHMFNGFPHLSKKYSFTPFKRSFLIAS